MYFHMNWGWHEVNSSQPDYNGWYSYNDWHIYELGVNFNYYNYAITEIHP
ncbi:MAG: hypothetical protein ABIR50_02910 [Ginsengibacter sp.]